MGYIITDIENGKVITAKEMLKRREEAYQEHVQAIDESNNWLTRLITSLE